MKKKWVWIGLTSFMLSYGMQTVVYAETNDSNIANNVIQKEKNIEKNKKMLDNMLLEIGNLQTELKDMEKEIRKIQKEIDKTDGLVVEMNGKMTKTKEEIKIKEKELEKKKEMLSRNLKIMYQKGETGFVEFLLSSESMSRLIYRYEILQEVSERHEKVIDDVKNIVDDLEKQKRGEQKMKNNLHLEMLKQFHSKKKVNEMKIEKEQLVTSIDKKYQDVQNEILQDQDIIMQMIYEMQEMEMYKGYNTDELAKQIDSTVMTGTDIVDIAYKWVMYRGAGSKNPVKYSMPYRQLSLASYGDCSAFTRRVYLDAGYGHIGYTTADQIANPKGDFIEKVEDLQPGDLMYFGPTGSHVVYSYLPNGKKVATAHTAIYIGNGKMIDLSAGVGTISIKDFSEGGSWEWYVKNRWVGGKRFYKEIQPEQTKEEKETNKKTSTEV